MHTCFISKCSNLERISFRLSKSGSYRGINMFLKWLFKSKRIRNNHNTRNNTRNNNNQVSYTTIILSK